MTQARAGTFTVRGIEAVPVDVQADVSRGLPAFVVVGLGDAAVLEARDRVRAAVRAAGFEFPSARVVVNLAPAPLRKHGTGFDLPIALALLRATGQVPACVVEGVRSVGELSLDGTVRGVSGTLAHARAAAAAGESLTCSVDSAHAAASVPGATVRAVRTLAQYSRGLPEETRAQERAPGATGPAPDLSEVAGNAMGKRVLEISAAGGHNLLMVGPPGSGKTMLARRLPGILPELTAEEALETALVHSVAGLDESAALRRVRPFRSPHHTISTAGLVGGGSPPRPGEAGLAHNGVLFLDELPHFAPSALQSLRQPLEDGRITLVRADGRITFPSRLSLVAAMNPCPCGHLGDRDRACTCPESERRRYFARIGGPLLDRIDISVRVDRVDARSLLSHEAGESSAAARRRIDASREAARGWGREPGEPLSGAALLAACSLTPEARTTVTSMALETHLSGRGVTRLLRVSRTIADLAGSHRVADDHVLEACTYRLP